MDEPVWWQPFVFVIVFAFVSLSFGWSGLRMDELIGAAQAQCGGGGNLVVWGKDTNVSGLLLANNAGKPRTVTNKQPARSHQRHAGEERRQEGLRQNVTG